MLIEDGTPGPMSCESISSSPGVGMFLSDDDNLRFVPRGRDGELEPRGAGCELIPVTSDAVRVNWVTCTSNDMRRTFSMSVAGRRVSSQSCFILWVAGGVHGYRRSSVRRETLARRAGITSREGDDNLREFVPSDTSIESLREDDSMHSQKYCEGEEILDAHEYVNGPEK